MNKQDSVFDGGWKIDTDANTLVSYLWEQADDEAITDVVDDIVSIHGISRTEAEGIVDALLTALVGPRPTEQESDDE